MSNKQIGETTKTLIEARSLIENPDNWCQGLLENEHGQMCAVGALYEE